MKAWIQDGTEAPPDLQTPPRAPCATNPMTSPLQLSLLLLLFLVLLSATTAAWRRGRRRVLMRRLIGLKTVVELWPRRVGHLVVRRRLRQWRTRRMLRFEAI